MLDVGELGRGPWSRRCLRCLQRMAEPLLRTGEFNHAYAGFVERDREGGFFDRALSIINVGYTVTRQDLERIPADGPVFLVANHPFGGVDGLILGSLLRRRRADGKLLVNRLLERVDGMGEHACFVDPFGGEGAAARNLGGMREALRWLKDGHALATFPAGTVSHWHWKRFAVRDPQWAENVAGLIQRSGATVVPVYFGGRNSLLFQLAGMIHPRLRTLLLPRELLRRRNSRIEVRIGRPIAARHVAQREDNREATDYLRLRTYVLKSRDKEAVGKESASVRVASAGEPVVDGQDPALLEDELADLSPERCLVRQGDFEVWEMRAAEAPHILLELGRLRELTFRAVGEGTGQRMDLDRFDRTYRHLVLWHRSERRILGAYRMGLSDEILPMEGKNGFYCSTLFRFKGEVLTSLNPAVELGRSFVVEDYQRKRQPLSLLWRGIGQFIVKNPRYGTLFGPVTISREYRNLSRKLMVTYLKRHTLDKEWSSRVRARRPPRSFFLGALDRDSFERSVRTIEDVSALIAEIEKEMSGVPVLLRHYLKLNATLLSFNVDPDFSDCLDGLVLVDLRRTPKTVLERYMGLEGARAFGEFHDKQRREKQPAVGGRF